MTTASAANWAEPAKTRAAVAMAWSGEKPASRASTPNDSESTNPTAAYGTPSRTPDLNEARLSSAATVAMTSDPGPGNFAP